MPFNVTSAARFERRITMKFNREQLEVFYNAGEQYKEYQVKAQQLDQEFADLQHQLQTRPVSSASDDDGTQEARELAYEQLKAAMAGARRRIADNVCWIITQWDLEGDRSYIKTLIDPKEAKALEKADKKTWLELEGHGPIPIEGVWLDALPLPDEFILDIVTQITNNFQSGGAGGKGRLKAS